MAVTETIQELLQGIDDAQYGRDMRQYIHKGIQKCYEEGSAGETDLQARTDIEKLANNFGSVESTSTASKAYAQGDTLIYDNVLYKVTTAIAQGDTLVEGTNIEQTNVAGNGVVGDLYEIPFNQLPSWDSISNSKLFIIPSIKLMLFYLNISLTGGASYSTYEANRLPIPRAASNFFYYMADATAYVQDTTTNALTLTSMHLQSSKTDSQADDNCTLTVPIPSLANDSKLYGSLIVPYARLNTYYPMSSATLVS